MWLEFFDSVCDILMEFEVVLNQYSEEFCGRFLFEGCVVERELNIWMCVWVEGGVCGFGLVRDKVVGVKELDETGEIGLCMLF